MGLSNALKHRPVRVLGFIAALHAMIYGFGLILGTGGFSETVLYTALGSQTTVTLFSVALLITGGFLAFAYARNNPKTIAIASGACGTVWIYCTLAYLLGGAWLLAIGIGLPWTILAYYLAFAHSNRTSIIAYDQTWQARVDTANEDQL